MTSIGRWGKKGANREGDDKMTEGYLKHPNVQGSRVLALGHDAHSPNQEVGCGDLHATQHMAY